MNHIVAYCVCCCHAFPPFSPATRLVFAFPVDAWQRAGGQKCGRGERREKKLLLEGENTNYTYSRFGLRGLKLQVNRSNGKHIDSHSHEVVSHFHREDMNSSLPLNARCNSSHTTRLPSPFLTVFQEFVLNLSRSCEIVYLKRIL